MEGYSVLVGRAAVAISILIFSTHIISSSAIQPLTNNTNAQYIKTSCSSTTYPELCYNTLSIYATKIQNNPKVLAQVALNVTLRATTSASEFMKNVSKRHGLKPREAAAMADCVEETDQAVYELERSTGELSRVGSGSSSSREINDIQTWVSAALTDDTTCMDGLGGNDMEGEVKNIVKDRMTKIAHLTSISLALINNFASSSQGGNSALVV